MLRLSNDVISQFADPFDFEFDCIACLQEAAHFESAAAAILPGFRDSRGAGAKEFAWMKGFIP